MLPPEILFRQYEKQNPDEAKNGQAASHVTHESLSKLRMQHGNHHCNRQNLYGKAHRSYLAKPIGSEIAKKDSPDRKPSDAISGKQE